MNVSIYLSILSPALCLEWVSGSLARSLQTEHSVRQIGLAGAATATADERAQLIDRWWHITKTATHTLSMSVCDCIRYKKWLKLFIHLRISSESVTTRSATWNPAKWHENQIETRSKTLLISQTLRTSAGLVAF